MYYKAVFPGQYIQGEGVINELPGLIDNFGSKGLLIGSKTVLHDILPRFSSFEKDNFQTELFNGECSERELHRLADIIVEKSSDVIIGMGGGKVIDTAKILADRAKIPVIIVPTIASTDAPCSACAVVYSDEGEFDSVHYQKRSPAVILVDSKIIATSPSRFLVAGMGDALATVFEAKSCHRTQSKNECGGLSTMTGLSIAQLCYDTILKYGKYAKIANDANIVSPALNYVIEANILLSGIGFESSGLGAAHSIHNGLTALQETHNYFHGEKVAFGVLAGLFLTDAEPTVIEEVFSFSKSIGLPVCFTDLGIAHLSKDELMTAAQKACESGQYIHHEAGEMNPEKVLNAMIMADAFANNR